jgi:hypothetical protein
VIAALKRTRLYQRYRQARERRRQRSRKGLARTLERVLLNEDAMLRALTHLVERADDLAALAERRGEELSAHLERLEDLLASQREELKSMAEALEQRLDRKYDLTGTTGRA